MANQIRSTGLVPDEELEDTDKYGNVPLFAYVDESEDDSGAEEEAPEPLIEASTRDVLVDPNDDLEDDDEDAYNALTSYDGGGLSPGEAEAVIDYMRPLTPEEEELAQDPMFRDLQWIDDAAHTDDLLAKTKGTRAISDFMRDASYGDDMNNEERAERHDSDHSGAWVPKNLPKVNNQSLVAPKASRYALFAKRAKYAVVSGLGRTLVKEHADWLEDQDRARNIPVRPKSFYLNVSKLWAKDRLAKASLPATSSGDFSGSVGAFVGAAEEVLNLTQHVRKPSTGLSGWGFNPISAVRSVARKTYATTKKVVKKTAVSPLSMAVKVAKKTTIDPLKYGYKVTKKSIEWGLSQAQKLALAPLKLIIKRFSNKIVSRRANFLAKQAGLAKPTPAMRSQALTWSKSFVKANNPRYGNVISALMGDGPGIYAVDLSLGDTDMMGYSARETAGLIALGPIGLGVVLASMLKGGSKQAPAPEDGSEEAAAEDQYDPNAEGGDEGGDEGSSDADASPASDESGASRMWTSRQDRKTINIEQLSAFPPKARTRIQAAICAGRIRLV
jgi:hypothetical protein